LRGSGKWIFRKLIKRQELEVTMAVFDIYFSWQLAALVNFGMLIIN